MEKLLNRVVMGGCLSLCLLLAPLLLATEAFMPTGAQFSLESRKAWDKIQSALSDERIKTRVLEKDVQVIITRPLRTLDQNTNWLSAPEVPSGYLFESAEIHLFVSPFVEPARIYVGSVSTFKVLLNGGSATLYNDPKVNASVMAWVTRTLGMEAQPVPTTRSAGQSGAPTCVPSGSDTKKIVPPKRIESTRLEVLYPRNALADRQAGSVVVKMAIREDGSTGALQLDGTPPEHSMGVSALGAASLLRYQPALFGGCRVTAQMTYTVNFRLY
ncbi:MAG: energy transducer TonB [Vicinamibacteria bacterium]|nr:energy transducer TonB [Vicinamibacteria bacterium]